MEVNIKIGHYNTSVSEKDIILDNGSCYQLMTKTIFSGWSDYPMQISKTQFAKLKKKGLVYTNEALEDFVRKKYGIKSYIVLYKFDIPAMIEAGYEIKQRS